MELIGFAQKYSWGKRGKNSLVARLANENHESEIDNDTPYSELWMGVHPSGPSRLKTSGKLLSEHLAENPHELGEDLRQTFNDELPFLLKVLSVQQALSIQAHPSKTLAEHLNKKYPDIYKDSNHKPELAIGLTKFEALCGFRPLLEIKNLVKEIPSFEQLIGKENIDSLLNGSLKNCFETLMRANVESIEKVIANILASNDNKDETRLVRRLNQQFPNDVGVLCVYFLNYIVLAPGEALYLPANEPHAYIFGDCVECMANSDNVVRAGLTPKFRDVQTLCDMLTYISYSPNEIKFKAVVEDLVSQLFQPPVNDFAVCRTVISPNESEYSLKPRKTASLLLCLDGFAQLDSILGLVNLKIGIILYIPAYLVVTIRNITKEIVLFQAFCNI